MKSLDEREEMMSHEKGSNIGLDKKEEMKKLG